MRIFQSAFVGASVIGLSMFATQAQAQCTDDTNVAAKINGVLQPAQNLFPLGRGSSLTALTSTINTVNTAFLTSSSGFVSAKPDPAPDQPGGGVWGRVVVGTSDVTSSSVGVFDTTKLGFQAQGQQNCRSKVHEDYTGAQFGYDLSTLNQGGKGSNWHWGITGGYLQAKLSDVTPAGSFSNLFFLPFQTPTGDLSDTTKVPFVGLYTVFTQNGYFVDGQIRTDFYRNVLADPNNSISGLGFNATGLSATVNGGYSMALGSNVYIQPSAGAVLSRVQVGSITTPIISPGPFSGYGGGTIAVSDITSLLGRATLKVGTTLDSQGVKISPFVAVSLFHEFNGDVTASTVIASGNTGVDGAALMTTSRGGVGTYGQYALGIDADFGGGWLGYVRGDIRRGDELQGASGGAGLRYQW
jgi:autotransporter-like protein